MAGPLARMEVKHFLGGGNGRKENSPLHQRVHGRSSTFLVAHPATRVQARLAARLAKSRCHWANCLPPATKHCVVDECYAARR